MQKVFSFGIFETKHNCWAVRKGKTGGKEGNKTFFRVSWQTKREEPSEPPIGGQDFYPSLLIPPLAEIRHWQLNLWPFWDGLSSLRQRPALLGLLEQVLIMIGGKVDLRESVWQELELLWISFLDIEAEERELKKDIFSLSLPIR